MLAPVNNLPHCKIEIYTDWRELWFGYVLRLGAGSARSVGEIQCLPRIPYTWKGKLIADGSIVLCPQIGLSTRMTYGRCASTQMMGRDLLPKVRTLAAATEQNPGGRGRLT